MSIKDNLEKAAAIFGAPNEPKCVFMDKATKDKIVSEKLEKQMHEAIADMFERNTPVAKKPFDISEHKFSDHNVTAEGVVNDYVDLSIAYEQWGGHINGYSEEEKAVNINKPDAIAIAKALGVTGEDLL